MSGNVLVLNADYSFLEIVNWQKAICLILEDKVRLVEQYADRVIRSVSSVLAFPSVVARTNYVRMKLRLRYSRRNVFARDSYTCQYCGAQPDRRSLTIDHIIPRSKGGRTRWENVVTSCASCNHKKANRTLAESGMKLLTKPIQPIQENVAAVMLRREIVPSEWLPYIDHYMPKN